MIKIGDYFFLLRNCNVIHLEWLQNPTQHSTKLFPWQTTSSVCPAYTSRR